MRANKPISVTLGKLGAFVNKRVKSGAYTSVSEVVRAGLRALEREEAMLDQLLRRQVERSLADPRPSIPAEKVKAKLEAYIARSERRREKSK
jgi:antitoxin ParD1/3/4